ncbi:MAG: ABC transporter ATP-binding protein [Oscillospiraceae bacterium]|nr:ABC transporter ATP-binding protein [Oscillospiraceae bacterium]MBR3001238.1 ABC transporter ATP-binding protein [Oscillospiraceae bacterium]
MAFIELKDVSYKYPYTKNFALQNVTCSFERGKFYGIIGENGGGKTTLCNLIRGLIPHFYLGKLTGECLVEGKDIREWDTAELSSKIGYVFQNPFTQISGIKPTVFEEVAIGLENLGVPKEIMLDRVAKVCEQLDIGHLIKNNPNELSGGQRQRVAFASIIAMDTDTLVIDEPTSQLDPEGTESVFNIINQLKHSNKTIILVEHKIDLIAEFCDEILVMENGTIAFNGPTKEILAKRELMDHNAAIPEVAKFGHAMEDAGKPLSEIPVTLNEALELVKERRAR